MRKIVILFAILAAILVGNMVVAHPPCRGTKGCHPVAPFRVNVVNVYKEAENKCSNCGETGGTGTVTSGPIPTITATGTAPILPTLTATPLDGYEY